MITPSLSEIPHPPTLDLFGRVLGLISRELEKDGKTVLLGADTQGALSALADAIGQMERAATPLPSKRRKRAGDEPAG